MNVDTVLGHLTSRVVVALIATAAWPSEALADTTWQIEGETGIAIVDYNDIRIPGNSGTLFSATEDLAVDPAAFIRLRFSFIVDSAHFVGLLGLPLQYSASGTLTRDTQFQDLIFNAGDFVRVGYRFNSWRLTYRYQAIHPAPRLQLGFGFTAKIRDAAISMEGNNGKREETDIGFVPLLNLRVDWSFSDHVGLRFELDGLAAPQGRAFDGLLALTFEPVDGLVLHVGYRALEGGADNDTVYNFTWIHFATVGASLRF